MLFLAAVVCPAWVGGAGTAELGGARRSPGQVFRDCEFCPEMVVVPAGRFRMGCVSGVLCQDDELPVHEVRLRSFALTPLYVKNCIRRLVEFEVALRTMAERCGRSQRHFR